MGPRSTRGTREEEDEEEEGTEAAAGSASFFTLPPSSSSTSTSTFFFFFFFEVVESTTTTSCSPARHLPRRSLSLAVSVQISALRQLLTDSSASIERSHLARLTERFYRIDAGRSRRLGGTGLGLAIVKHIVKRHRGHLSIESEIGRGSVFTVSLPVAGAAQGSESRPLPDQS